MGGMGWADLFALYFCRVKKRRYWILLRVGFESAVSLFMAFEKGFIDFFHYMDGRIDVCVYLCISKGRGWKIWWEKRA